MNSAAPGPSTADEFTVRIPRDGRKKITLMKFGSGVPIDFSKIDQPVRMERENNLKEYKSANDLDLLPKFGAGSEYGRDLKEESKRRKFGILLKKYSPEDQPWHLKVGQGKQGKKYKGVREGSISDNTSYYIFTKAADGAFEAFPVEEWYNFSPVIQYRFLNSDEAEEEYSRRDKILNHWMLKYKYKQDDDNVDDEEDNKKKGGKKKSKKNLQLTDMEDWDDFELSDDDDDSNGEMGDEGKSKKKKSKAKNKKNRRNAKQNSDDEAIEESDEGDYDDKEVDYMSDSGSDSDLSGGEKDDKKTNKYDDKGVDMEAGLRNILDSDAEDEEEETPKDEPEEDIDEKEEKKPEKKEKGADDSSSSSSEDDSDIEKDAERASKLFLTGDRKIKKEKKEKPDSEPSVSSTKEKTQQIISQANSEKLKDKGLKRKAEKLTDKSDSKSPSIKKHRSEESEGALEEDLRRYLMRKPMTTKDLLQKFKSKKLNMTNEKITQVIAQLLKKINPDKTTINKKLYLSLKKDDIP